jgi:hypothetical protein
MDKAEIEELQRERKEWIARMDAVNCMSGYEIDKLLGGTGGNATRAFEATEKYCPHKVRLLRTNLNGGGDLGGLMNQVVEHFERTEYVPDVWSAILIGGAIDFDFRNENDAVLVRLLLDG